MALLTLSDGRTFEYDLTGDIVAGGPALVFHHGTPGGALVWDGLAAAGVAQELPIVVYSRAGYGQSDRSEGRSVADVVQDVTGLLDHLGVGRFVTTGWSGGGPHSLVCAALMAPRCAAVATIVGVAPHDAEGLDFTADMGPENVEEFKALLAGDAGLEEKMAAETLTWGELAPEQVADALGGLISPPDRACLDEGFAEYMTRWMHIAAQGSGGYWDDNVAFVRPWGFDISDIDVPVTVYIAGQDLMVPAAHGEWLAAHVPGARRVRHDDEGHISLIVHHIADVVAGLVEDAGAL